MKNTHFPNVIVIMTDEQRYDSLSCMGNPALKTPYMDALIRGGCQFESAFCYYVGDKEELYDLSADPLEKVNLAADPSHAEVKTRMKNRLLDWMLTAPMLNNGTFSAPDHEFAS